MPTSATEKYFFVENCDFCQYQDLLLILEPNRDNYLPVSDVESSLTQQPKFDPFCELRPPCRIPVRSSRQLACPRHGTHATRTTGGDR